MSENLFGAERDFRSRSLVLRDDTCSFRAASCFSGHIEARGLTTCSMSQDPPGILYEFWRRLIVLLGLACANSDMLSASQFTPACLAAARSCCSRFCFADSMRLRHLSTPVAESEKSDGFEFRSAILSGTEVSAAGCSCVLRKAANALAFRSAFFFARAFA